MSWTDARVTQLKVLIADGLSASQIAGELGGVTRNAVIGKAGRLGLQLLGAPRGGGARPGAGRKPSLFGRATRVRISTPRQERQHVAREKAAANRRAIFAVEDVTELPEEDTSAAVGFLQLGANTCRWPIGDPQSLDTIRFCGAEPFTERPYCLRHCRMAYRKSERQESARA